MFLIFQALSYLKYFFEFMIFFVSLSKIHMYIQTHVPLTYV